MKCLHLLLTGPFFATSLLAATHGIQRRNAGMIATGQDPGNTRVVGSYNWAGAVLNYPAGETYNYIHGVLTVPSVAPPPGSGDGSWGSAAWIGLGGSHNPILFQVAVLSLVNSSSSTTMQSFSAAYEWIPAPIVFIDMEICAGDEIAMTVFSNHDGSTGTIRLNNKSNGQHFHTVVSMPAPNTNIKGDTADWIVEDYSVGAGLEPLADFGTVTFTDCVAKVGSEHFGLENATVTAMYSPALVLEANATVEGSSTVEVYVSCGCASGLEVVQACSIWLRSYAVFWSGSTLEQEG